MIEVPFPAPQNWKRSNARVGLAFRPIPPQERPKSKSLVLRACREDMSSGNGFKWPWAGAMVEAPDWQPTHRCGSGLHGWLHGHGDHAIGGYIEPTANWLVIEVDTDDIIELDGFCKFPRGKVVFVGTSKGAADYLLANDPCARDLPLIGAHRAVGDHRAVFVGALGCAIAGNCGTAMAGYRGVATVGYGGTATTGFRGESTAGVRGTAIAGDGGTARAGNHGTAMVGFSGKASAGEKGQISIWYWDFYEMRYRMKIGYIGEEDLEPNTLYTLDDNHRFIKV
ncbi:MULTISPECIES: hypothetical protein [unclassified Caballeronia]|uniref:DUF7666 domain-containing protein n=1 Tax=unclassified Caballeronia TaxID=2646786 RepID=UPI00285CC685|nr:MULTISPECIES: hypothetical protein [unclassified Caballeronia]MDR5775933.1 hypothetical protein [Caballeronia sp. LZ002]MDR5801478.1 hypothetical protein [Caballeronia sp. LZ001]MDR5851372.1 hypothetical protein [Caballeronia sp. LZ003]